MALGSGLFRLFLWAFVPTFLNYFSEKVISIVSAHSPQSIVNRNDLLRVAQFAAGFCR